MIVEPYQTSDLEGKLKIADDTAQQHRERIAEEAQIERSCHVGQRAEVLILTPIAYGGSRIGL